MSSAPWRHKRAQIANKARRLGPDHPELVEDRRDLRALNLADYVERTLAVAPPLTDEQREQIAALLRAGGAK